MQSILNCELTPSTHQRGVSSAFLGGEGLLRKQTMNVWESMTNLWLLLDFQINLLHSSLLSNHLILSYPNLKKSQERNWLIEDTLWCTPHPGSEHVQPITRTELSHLAATVTWLSNMQVQTTTWSTWPWWPTKRAFLFAWNISMLKNL